MFIIAAEGIRAALNLSTEHVLMLRMCVGMRLRMNDYFTEQAIMAIFYSYWTFGEPMLYQSFNVTEHDYHVLISKMIPAG